jgi:hypothetical protein
MRPAEQALLRSQRSSNCALPSIDRVTSKSQADNFVKPFTRLSKNRRCQAQIVNQRSDSIAAVTSGDCIGHTVGTK